MSNIRELEIDGMKASELHTLTKKSWLPFVAFVLLILTVGAFTVRLVFVAADIHWGFGNASY